MLLCIYFLHFMYFISICFIPDVISSSCNIVNCDTDYTCEGNQCSKCLPGYYKYFSSCRKCYLGCLSCNGGQCYNCNPPVCVNGTDICDYATCDKAGCSGNVAVKCSGCPDGFYLENSFCFRCDHVNCKCYFANSCDQCLPGYYDTNTLCTKCVPGKYGHSCELSCISTCDDGTCGKESGLCLTGCASDEYLDDTGQCQPCPNPRCASCVNSTYCSSCKQPFHWNPTCEYDCVGCYNSCDRLEGCSGGCTDTKYYSTYNLDKKGYECIRCFNQCYSCINETYCTSCFRDIFWGRKCLYSCNNCDGTCDKDYGCIDNCELGYYREQVDEGHECKPCSDHCKQCLDTSSCQACEDGYYVDDISKFCISCSINCTDNICDSSNGTCTSRCLPGSTGYRCNKQCPTNCFECDQFDSSNCVSCKSKFYGEYCENVCSQYCKYLDGIHECLKEDGACKHGCEAGFWSITCSKACSEQCVDKTCNKTTGKCSHGCKTGFHGLNCSLTCPANCCGNKCFQDNGTCLVESISEPTSTTSRNVEGKRIF